MEEVSINLWAVVAAAAAAMVVGFAWYGPLFGKYWMRLMGYTPDSIKSMNMTAGQSTGIAVVSALVQAYILAHFADVWGVFDASGALELAFWLWLGFVATTQLSSVLWENRPWKLWAFNTVSSLVSISIMSLIVTYWR